MVITMEMRSVLNTVFSVILLLSMVITLLLFAIIWRYLGKKALGMQTPLDTLIKDLLIISYLASIFASLNSLKWGLPAAYPKLGVIQLRCQLFTGLALYLQILATVFVRYLMVFHHKLTQAINDSTIIASSRIAIIAITTTATLYEHLNFDATEGPDYAYLTGISNPNMQPRINPSIKLLIFSSILCSLVMQVRVELLKQEDQLNVDKTSMKITFRLMVTFFLLLNIILLAWLDRATDDPEGMPKLVFQTLMNVILYNFLPAGMILKNENLTKFAKKNVLIV